MSKNIKLNKKKLIVLGGAAVLLVVIVVAVVLIISGSSFKTDESAVCVKNNGKIMEAGIEAFDEEVYSADELKEFVKAEVAAYNNEAGGSKVKVKKLKIKDNVAKLYLNYASADDYEAFHGEEFYAGSLAGAAAEGYILDMELNEVENGKKTGSKVNYNEVSDNGYKVVIMEERVGIQVKGNILFASKNVDIVDKDTVSPKKNAEGQVAADKETYIVVIYK